MIKRNIEKLSENQLETILYMAKKQDLAFLEPGLRILGRQVICNKSIIDLFGKAKAKYVVIEIKSSKGAYLGIGQLVKYLVKIKQAMKKDCVYGLLLNFNMQGELRIKANGTYHRIRLINLGNEKYQSWLENVRANQRKIPIHRPIGIIYS